MATLLEAKLNAVLLSDESIKEMDDSHHHPSAGNDKPDDQESRPDSNLAMTEAHEHSSRAGFKPSGPPPLEQPAPFNGIRAPPTSPNVTLSVASTHAQAFLQASKGTAGESDCASFLLPTLPHSFKGNEPIKRCDGRKRGTKAYPSLASIFAEQPSRGVQAMSAAAGLRSPSQESTLVGCMSSKDEDEEGVHVVEIPHPLDGYPEAARLCCDSPLNSNTLVKTPYSSLPVAAPPNSPDDAILAEMHRGGISPTTVLSQRFGHSIYKPSVPSLGDIRGSEPANDRLASLDELRVQLHNTQAFTQTLLLRTSEERASTSSEP